MSCQSQDQHVSGGIHNISTDRRPFRKDFNGSFNYFLFHPVMTEGFTFGPDPEKYAARQIYLATEILRGKEERVPVAAIASFFKVSKGTIHQHWQRCRKGPVRLPGRKPTIPAPIKRQMFTHIAHEFDQGRPVGYEAILDWIYTKHQVLILPDTLRHCIRKAASMKTV
jgi:hypothetical protein